MRGIVDVENLGSFKYPLWGAKNGPFFDLAGLVLRRRFLFESQNGAWQAYWNLYMAVTSNF